MDILEGFTVDTITRLGQNPAVFRIGNSRLQRFFTTQFLLGSDGTQSIVSKKLSSTRLNPWHHAAAVRTYYSGLKDLQVNRTEVFLLPEFMPGYFRVFPLSEYTANVGFGMLSHSISRKKVKLKESFYALSSIRQS